MLSNWLLQYTVLILDQALTYILQQQIWQKDKKQYITAELKFSIIYHWTLIISWYKQN
jgi:hypothetical protein